MGAFTKSWGTQKKPQVTEWRDKKLRGQSKTSAKPPAPKGRANNHQIRYQLRIHKLIAQLQEGKRAIWPDGSLQSWTANWLRFGRSLVLVRPSIRSNKTKKKLPKLSKFHKIVYTCYLFFSEILAVTVSCTYTQLNIQYTTVYINVTLNIYWLLERFPNVVWWS